MTAYDDDIEAILGGGDIPLKHGGLQPVPRKSARRAANAIRNWNKKSVPGTNRQNPRELSEEEQEVADTVSQNGNIDTVKVKHGVTVTWLAAIFGKSTEWVRRRLVDCPPVSQSGKAFRYDIATAAEYLVDPKVDITKYLRDLKAADLPAQLQKEIWDARLKRQKWEALAGDLWHTRDVMAVLSSTFAIVKSSIQLWPDTVERQIALTDEQRELLIRLGDTLQDEVYQGLVDAAKQRSTRASIADAEGIETVSEDDDDDDLEDVL